MAFINFESKDRLGRRAKEAINTDRILHAYYDATTSEIVFTLIYEGEVSKNYGGSAATALYRHIRALPNFVEAPRSEGAEAFDLVNLNHALHLFYWDKADLDDGKSTLSIEYGMSSAIVSPRQEPGRVPASHGRSVEISGEKAEEIWKKYQGTAL